MHLLVRPEHYLDESLESYLLRLSLENGFTSVSEMLFVFKQWLHVHDHEASGAIPLKLELVNIYHANRSSGYRIRALRLIEQLTEKQPLKMLELALVHSSAIFGANITAVHRNSIDLPQQFIRTSNIPICPKCLQEAEYIRQLWHYLPYSACHQHQCQLIERCPSCGALLNYQKNGFISVCECGFHLCYAESINAANDQIQLSRLISGWHFDNTKNPLLTTPNLSLRFGVLLWYYRRFHSQQPYGDDCGEVLTHAISYFEHWPEIFYSELKHQIDSHYEYQIKKSNQTAFREIFGALLTESHRLPMSDIGRNFILKAVVEFFIHQIQLKPKSKTPNIGDVLITPQEAACLLSTGIEQVYRLYQEGFIALAVKPNVEWHISSYLPAFYLREVIELRLARMQSADDSPQTYLPTW